MQGLKISFSKQKRGSIRKSVSSSVCGNYEQIFRRPDGNKKSPCETLGEAGFFKKLGALAKNWRFLIDRWRCRKEFPLLVERVLRDPFFENRLLALLITPHIL